MKDKKLLIITGVQRSGNTLLAKLIGNHSKIEMEMNPSFTTIFNSHNLLLKNIKNGEIGSEHYVKEKIVSNFKYWHPKRLNSFDFKNWRTNILSEYINYQIKDNNSIYLGAKMPDYCNNLEEIEMKKVCDFLGISFNKKMVNLRDKNTESQDSYIIPFFDKSKFEAFKNLLTKKQIRNIESYCKEEMELLGYAPMNKVSSKKVITRRILMSSKLKQDFVNLFKTDKMHMSNNQLRKVKVPIKIRFKAFLLSVLNIVLPNVLMEILFKNNRLYK